MAGDNGGESDSARRARRDAGVRWHYSFSVYFAGDMKFEDYKIILYRQEDGSWVAEIPALPACYALMKTREEALAELPNVFSMIEEESRQRRSAASC